jgi:hypothetical protein
MRRGRTLCLMAALALISAAPPCAAQGVPTPQDTLENNLNALRGPSPGAPTRVGVPTPQQSLDSNIGGLRSTGQVRNAPTPQYYPPASARKHDRHPGADALLSPSARRVAPGYAGHRQKARAGRRKARVR